MANFDLVLFLLAWYILIKKNSNSSSYIHIFRRFVNKRSRYYLHKEQKLLKDSRSERLSVLSQMIFDNTESFIKARRVPSIDFLMERLIISLVQHTNLPRTNNLSLYRVDLRTLTFPLSIQYYKIDH